VEGAAVDRYAKHLDRLLLDATFVARHLPGADRAIDAIVSRAIAAGVGGADSVLDNGPGPETERIAEVALRKGPDVFRARVLANYAHTCAFCGLRSRLPDENSFLLLASHIRPWRNASAHERLDPRNGISLCAIHDRAFDWGFLTVDRDFRVQASRHAHDHYAPEERVRAEILDLNGRSLARPDRDYVPPAEPYLAFHRENVFEKRFRCGA
jgi:putative restriction endonuclease